MSELYAISVQKLENETTVLIDVQVVHPDAMYISSSPSFALQLLQESARDGAPLGAEVDYEQTMDADWVRQYARGFIRDVYLVDLENEVPPEAEDDYDHPYWEDSAHWLRGTLRVEVTDPAWIAHLEGDEQWDSAAFEVSSTADPCEPILYEAEASRPAEDDLDAQEPHAGLFALPRVFWPSVLREFDEDIIWFPKYAKNAYVAQQTYEGAEITDELKASLVGKVVLQSRYGGRLGVVTPDGQLLQVGRGSYGQGSLSGPQISVMRFNPHAKRLGTPLGASQIVDNASATVLEVRVEGDTVSLDVCRFDAADIFEVENLSQALALIAAPVWDDSRSEFTGESALASALREEFSSGRYRVVEELYPKVARAFVSGLQVEKVRDGDAIDLDALSEDELRAVLAARPWHTWQVDITVSDPRFVEHLPAAGPFEVPFMWMIGAPE